MSRIFSRSSAITCFFCQSSILPAPENTRSFRCPHCAVWNRYDAHGEIMSDEAAMHEEALNAHSFAKRASPSKGHLPPLYGAGPFCHTCQTNQMMAMNLLSNYLPEPNDPEYPRRLEMLEDYKASLQLRYPPVCSNCQSTVDEEIKKKEEMARTWALGSMLKNTKGKERQKRHVSVRTRERERMNRELLVWRMRGILWIATALLSICSYMYMAIANVVPTTFHKAVPFLPFLTLLSIFWTFWDPTYRSIRRAQLQGRDIRQHGKSRYIRLQLGIWILRLLMHSMFLYLQNNPSSRTHFDLILSSNNRIRVYFALTAATELSAFVSSFFLIRLSRPPTIRLIDTTTHLSARPTPEPGSATTATASSRGITPMTTTISPSSFTAPIPRESDLFSTLSLSSNPIMAKPTVATQQQQSNPIFGLPSLQAPSHAAEKEGEDDDDDDALMGNEEDENAMDWTPTGPPGGRYSRARKGASVTRGNGNKNEDNEQGGYIRPQRFFPPEQPTGLESLFERTNLVDIGGSRLRSGALRGGRRKGGGGGGGGQGEGAWSWTWVYALSLVPILAIGFGAAWQMLGTSY